MGKYTPTDDDLYSTKPCVVCGRDVIDDKEDTCCWQCKQQWEIFKEDFQWFQVQGIEGR